MQDINIVCCTQIQKCFNMQGGKPILSVHFYYFMRNKEACGQKTIKMHELYNADKLVCVLYN